jgi:DNA primase catalytic core
MGLHKLTAGDGYTYLTRQVAAHDATEKGHTSLGDYYDQRGESPGRWLGTGLAGLDLRPGEPVTGEQMKALFGQGRHPNAVAREAAATQRGADGRAAVAAGALGRPFNVYEAASRFNTEVARAFTAHNHERGRAWDAAIPVEARARIRTEVGTAMFAAQHDRPPQDARELSGFVARASRQATSAVAGYDLTFSPVKSVSTLWALACPEVATQVREAHDAAVADTLGWLECEAVFTRVGRGGARQVATRGLVAAAFTHRDSRAGDPDLHTHVALSNKVQAEDGRWLALDGRLLYQANVAASERYNTRLEAELTARLGVRFRAAGTSGDKRPIREIEGINSLLTRWWSRRRRAIEARRSELAAEFQHRHGRPPTAVEAMALAQQATLETRTAKHASVSEAEQRAAWRGEADRVLGGAAEVDEMLDRALGHRPQPMRPHDAWVSEAATATVAAIAASRATWQVWHLRAEAERQARTAGIALTGLEDAVTRIVDQALCLSTRLGASDPVAEPPELRRLDGASVYEVHGSARYTSTRVLAAEHQLLQIARTTGGRQLSDVRVGIAVAESAANGCELNDAQAAMVADLATSGSLLQLGLAPAGTGKTTAMQALSRAWTHSGGHVVGLAPSARAAHQLGQAVDGHTDTLAKLTWTLANTPRGRWPSWVDAIGPRTLVIIDEAGQASTVELAAATTFITERGGIVRLIGDDQQLAAVGAGGVLRDIQHAVGAATLSEVHRFADHAEAAATLAVRDGDASALGFYADHGRIHVGDIGAVTDQAYAAWLADTAAGLDSILLAPTRELVSRLNARARADRPHAFPPTDQRVEVRLADGTGASCGDVIVTRHNERRLLLSASTWVKNGDRWTITEVHPDRSITVRHLELGRSLRLPAPYVAEHVQLGYAATVHAAQGMTTDTAHAVVTGAEARQLLYVALSRGRQTNHLYLATGHDGDPHSLIRPETLRPPTAIEVLAGILERDGSQHSATTTRRELDSPASQLRRSALRYDDALAYASEHTLGDHVLAALDAQLETLWPRLTQEPAYPTLRGHLALHALDGSDPLALLLEAAHSHGLDSAHDRAAVLDWRLGGRRRGPLPWLEAIPEAVADNPQWAAYLNARAARVTLLADTVRAEALAWSPAATPAWAAGLTASAHASLRGDLAVWRAAFHIPDTEHRPTGPTQPAADAATHQRKLNRRIRADSRRQTTTSEEPLRDALPHYVRTDPNCGRLTQRLSALANAGTAVDDLLNRVLTEPRPLPDEHAADALWWRVVGHLGPAALRATVSSGATLRPTWVPHLIARLGPDDAERVMADAAWPALVAAIHARPAEWPAEQLIDAVTDSHGHAVPVEDLCSALVWRVATMTDSPDEPEEAEPPEPAAVTSEPDRAVAEAFRVEPELPTSVDRIVELNRWTLNQYTAMYPRSWAPAYLRDRLGTDLDRETRFDVGYAPPGPVSLIQHLTSRGAAEAEVVDAGLARRTDDGRLIDTFRDRLVFPIYSGNDLVGFIGRRNPTMDNASYAGPKYLNTRTTAAFAKGRLLFGLAEGAETLRAGAIPVLVEGPLDAIAVTVATAGRAVGIAPLGTAFTDAQAAQLKPYFHKDHSRIVLATDPDPAGWTAAQKAFWRLASLGADPRHLALPSGVDPADVLRNEGDAVLTRRLSAATNFGARLLDHLVADTDVHDAAARLSAARAAARVIAALPPDQWTSHVERLTDRLALPPGMLPLEIIDAAEVWRHDPSQEARRQFHLLPTQALPPAPQPRTSSARTAARFARSSAPPTHCEPQTAAHSRGGPGIAR